MEQVVERIADGILKIRHVFTRRECAALIGRAESLGFEAASVRSTGGRRMMTNIRNNDRIAIHDEQLANAMWKRVEQVVPKLDSATPIGVDPQLRFYRYSPGQRFKFHKDGVVIDSVGRASKLSYLIYLNDDCEGGATVFRERLHQEAISKQEEYIVRPETGCALLFRHEKWHEGLPVTSGIKYVLRSDIFYEL